MEKISLFKSAATFTKSLFKKRTVGKRIPLKNGECFLDTNGKLMSAKTYYKDGSLKSKAIYNEHGQMLEKHTNLINGGREDILNSYRYGFLTRSKTVSPGRRWCLPHVYAIKSFKYDSNGKLQSISTDGTFENSIKRIKHHIK